MTSYAFSWKFLSHVFSAYFAFLAVWFNLNDGTAMVDLMPDARGVILPVRAHAGARRNAVVGEREGMLRVAVTAAPEKGKANQAIVAVLSKALGVPKSAIILVSGETSPQKRFLIAGGDAAALAEQIARLT